MQFIEEGGAAMPTETKEKKKLYANY